MIAVLVTCALLAPDPRLEFNPETIALLSLDVDDVPGEFARILMDSLATGIEEGAKQRGRPVRVVSQDDIEQMLNVQIQRLLVGCEDAQCIVEMGGSLDVEAAAAATVSKMGERYTAVVKIMDLKQARVYRRVSRNVDRESRLPTLLRVLGVEAVGGTPDPQMLEDLGPEPPVPVTSWHIGVSVGALMPATHFVGGNPFAANAGPLLIATADFAVAGRISVGGQASVASTGYSATNLDIVAVQAGMSIKVRFQPFDWLRLRPGLVLGYQGLFTSDADFGVTAGFGVGGFGQVGLVVWEGLALLLDMGLLAQVAGGNELVTVEFPAQFYIAGGVEWGGVDTF